MPSSPLTVTSAPPYREDQHRHSHHDDHYHHDNNNINLRDNLDPLDILTAEGRFGTTPGWLSGEASGECRLVVSGMDKIGELDPGEVR